MRKINVGEGGFPTIGEALSFISEIRTNGAAAGSATAYCGGAEESAANSATAYYEGAEEDAANSSMAYCEGAEEAAANSATAYYEGAEEAAANSATAYYEGAEEDAANSSMAYCEGAEEDAANSSMAYCGREIDANVPCEIHIAPGIYRERLEITEPYITLVGAGPDKTIITGSLGGKEILEDGIKRGTFRTQTAFVHTHDFTARDLTIENAAGPGHLVGQAIALYADGDRLYFENVHLKGFQDTLFTGPLPAKEIEPGGFRGPLEHAPRINGRQHYRRCTIEGSIDFIFGSATAYFEECTLVSRDEYAIIRQMAAKEEPGSGKPCMADGIISRQTVAEEKSGSGKPCMADGIISRQTVAEEKSGSGKPCMTDGTKTPAGEPPAGEEKKIRGYVTAPSTPEGQKYGYVFVDCTFTGDCPPETCYLGRPWREYAQVVLIRCTIGEHIRPEGWHDWGKEKAHETAYFAEYDSRYEGRSEDAVRGMRRHLQSEMLPDYEKDKVLAERTIS